MKKIIHKFFGLFGLELRRKGVVVPVVTSPPARDTMQMALARLKANGFSPNVVIDLGAAAGTWTEKALPYFPQATFLLFEPLEERKKELEKLSSGNSQVFPVFAAVGDKEGKVNFVVSDDLDGSGIYDSETEGGNRQVNLVTLDGEWQRRNLSGSCLLKFDTHGFELPILNGAKHLLGHTEIIIMECYNFKIASQSLLMDEMIQFLDKLGFRIADIVDIMRRPEDKIFWQCDIVFIRKGHPFFNSNKYSS